jgi:hypothetical protein
MKWAEQIRHSKWERLCGEVQPLNQQTEQQAIIRQYLLGRVPEAESAELDEQLVSDADFYEELLIAEEELIDQYLAGELIPEERQSFESHFLLTPERHEKLRFGRSFHNYLTPTTTLAVDDAEPDPVPERTTDVQASTQALVLLVSAHPESRHRFCADGGNAFDCWRDFMVGVEEPSGADRSHLCCYFDCRNHSRN